MIQHSFFLLAAEGTALSKLSLGLVLLVAIVVAFLVFGSRDLLRLSWIRISAISSVSFDESIRRRVLWITPLAIVGAVVVSQLQNAVDPQDAIRQTTKICLFATGLVVTLVAIILASTNLPREIDSRVIYTIVTKPTTRLEIVLGKIWGFAKVSAAILVIMGLFTYGYLHIRAWRLGSALTATLQAMPDDADNRSTLEHYKQAGLLNAKAMTRPKSLEMLAAPPMQGQFKLMAGGQGQRFAERFHIGPAEYKVFEDAVSRGATVAIVIDMPVTSRVPTAGELETVEQTKAPTTLPESAPATAPSTSPATQTAVRTVPTLGVAIQGRPGDYILRADQLTPGVGIEVPNGTATIPLVLAALDKMAELVNVAIVVDARSPAIDFTIKEVPVRLQVIEANGTRGEVIDPVEESKNPHILGTVGRYGQQLYGASEESGSYGVYHFDSLDGAAEESDGLTFEVKTGIEHGGEGDGESQTLPLAEFRVQDPRTGTLSEAMTFRPETNRIYYLTMPRSAFPASGEFNVLMRVLTPGQWLGINPDSVVLATGARSFAVNVAKSLLILWLMSILVVSIALFCSTFVSWPIAVVLTLVLLLGRWGVDQIGDAGGPGIGATMTGQTEDVVQARLVRSSVNALAKVLTVTSAFLPDISSFEATTDIERGISMPLSRMFAAIEVLLGYGVPMVILAYLVLKRKEVAP